MKQEEKQLLLADLCARLPYEVPIIPNEQVIPHKIVDIDFNKEVVIVQPMDRELIGVGYLGFEDFKMILRPMSSMTEEEIEIYRAIIGSLLEDSVTDNVATLYNFLNSKHLDYRGMIPMGLALEAPEGMYKN